MDVLLCKIGVLAEPECMEALEKMGYTVHLFSYDTDDYDGDKQFFQAFLQEMKERKYKFVFSICFLPIVSKICQIYHIRYISWIYDCPEMHLYAKAVKNPVNRIFVFDRVQYERFHAVSPETIFYMPLATKPMTEERFAAISETDREEYGHDVCFVGNLKYGKDEWLHWLPEYWRGYVQGIVEAQLNVYGYNFIADSLTEEAVSELKKRLGYAFIEDYREEDKDIIADMYIGKLCATLERERIFRDLSERYPVTIYTKSDTGHLPGVVNKGMADPVTVTPKIYHCSKINLNITIKSIQSGIPLRVFDVLGCKGFLLTNYQKEIEDYFEPGKDLVVYDSLADLREKIAYYLEHEEERRQIAENGYRKVCESFTYDIVIKEILEMSGCC
ncbi:MAG: glycosyltransferase [Bacteroidales bacterium]|nr:glycosyltransferase [Clostridium sp.]MCM1203839.1 glycosyltransferase [Bacteroidales bacterium]